MPVVAETFKSLMVVEQYMDDVLEGRIPACRYLILAVERQRRDMLTRDGIDLDFDAAAAQLAIDFIENLTHSKGQWAGQKLLLAPWQKFICWCIFGWKKQDGSRRFRIAYNEVARKNGKSTFAAAIGLLLLLMDDEQGAEIYTAATKMDQAKIIHKEATRMVNASQALRDYFGVGCHVNNIHVDSTNSLFEPLGADAKTLDGLNPSAAMIDELQAHRDSSVWDIIRSAIGSRRQPLMFAITTAGFNMHSFCYEQRDYAVKVLEGIIDDDSLFAIIFTLDRDDNGELLDDWKDETCWEKANPNLGVSVSVEDMRGMCKEAIESPTKKNNFLVKKLDVWTTQTVTWVNLEKWNACNEVVDEKLLVGKKCFAALDLSSNTDITAKMLLFPWDDGKYVAVPKFYIPKENAIARQRKDGVPYQKWADEGFITMTEGNVIDYKVVQADLYKDGEQYDIQLIGFDRWGFEAFRQRVVEEGIEEDLLISFGQGFQSMNAPMKELEKLYLSGKLIHNNNPVLAWMASNVAASMDPADSIKPDKKKSSEKIDGIVALIMTLGLAITQPAKEESIYVKRGMTTL
ncbi:MAG TPA: terminase large subunit [Phycisphaerales bacterium]|nr:terminase large subunit [Phycisphaerales bacterium]